MIESEGSTNMIKKVKAFIEENQMLEKKDRLVVGVSGGADSMCLLHCLLTIKADYELTLFVVHINHGIRGEDAYNDALFVEEFCKSQGIGIDIINKKVKDIAKIEGLSEEEAGRKVRYEAFEEVCKRENCNKIAIAHNQNDNAETVLFHMFRGSGIRGISGIPAVREIIIRPLLNCSRSEIEEYLKKNKISFRTDITNFEDYYSRNKIRRRILTYVEDQINPKAIEHITSLAREMASIDEYIDKNTQLYYKQVVSEREARYEISLELFMLLDDVIKQRIVKEVLGKALGRFKDIERRHILDIISLENKQVGKQIMLPYHIIVKRGYNTLDVSRLEGKDNQKEHDTRHKKNREILCEIPGSYFVDFLGVNLQISIENYKNSMRIPQNGYTKWFDYDKIRDAVVLRTRQPGDFLQIHKEGGRKSLKSIFIDKKIPKEQRDKMYLLTSGNHVLWILGERGTEGFYVDETTTKILVVTLSESFG